MEFMKSAYRRVKALFTSNALERDMEKEMRLHLDLLAKEFEQSGMSPHDAKLAARRRFGNLGRIQEQGRDIRGAGALDDLRRDIQYAWRTLRASPVFAAVIILSLALGIGANTALFSVFDALFLRDLPVRNPHELVAFGWDSGPSPQAFIPARIGLVNSRGSGLGEAQIRTVFTSQFSSVVVDKLRETAETLSDLAAFAAVDTDAYIDNQPHEISAQVVSGNYFRTVGVTAFAGRTITPEDDRASAEPVAVISHDFWRTHFALDRGAIGKQITLSSVVTATIVGVTPPGFHIGWGVSPDFSIPMAFLPQLSAEFSRPDMWILGMVGRMKPEVSVEQVTQNLESAFVAGALEGAPDTAPEDRPRLRAISGSDGFTLDYVIASITSDGPYRRFSLLLVMGYVLTVLLLIVCLNVANLLTARAETRRYEIGVRLAMGASRLRLIRQLLTESVMLAVLGGLIGSGLAYWGKDLLRLFLQQDNPLVVDLRIDPRVLAFSAGVSLLTGILFGLLPAFRATQVDVNSAVTQSGRSFSKSRTSVGRSLMVIQVAMSVVLLVCAFLLVRTLGNLPSNDAGFDMENLLVFRTNRDILGGDRNRYEQMIDRIRAVPGVRAVTASFDEFLGLGGRFTNGDFKPPVDGQHPDVRAGTVRLFPVRENFFEVLGIPIVRGRGFDAGDSAARPVAVITESLARQFGSDPIGWRFWQRGGLDVEVIGVVQNVGLSEIRSSGMLSPVHGTIFVPELQQEGFGFVSFAGTFEVRTAGNPIAVVPAIRAALREVDPNLRAFDIATETQLAERKLAPTRRIALAWSLFGGLALLLTCIGIYGLLSYSVTRRTNEIGIRIALGARRVHVFRLVIGQTFVLVFIGIAIGLAGSMIISQAIRAFIWGVTFYDPLAIALAVSVMIAVVAMAAYVPVRRASRVDPTVALRYE